MNPLSTPTLEVLDVVAQGKHIHGGAQRQGANSHTRREEGYIIVSHQQDVGYGENRVRSKD